MDAVTAGALGLFASGTVDGKATVWYSTDARQWQVLSGADNVIDQAPGAVVNAVLSTPAGVFAGGSYTSGTGLSAAPRGTPRTASTGPRSVTASLRLSGSGDQVITALVGIGAASSQLRARRPAAERPAGGRRRTDGSRRGSRRRGFPQRFLLEPDVRELPPGRRAAREPRCARLRGSGDRPDDMVAVGGSPGRQRLWQSTGGLAWSEIPLPPAARTDPDWHLGLVGADQGTTVLADNIPGQPYVLVLKGRQRGHSRAPTAHSAGRCRQPSRPASSTTTGLWF